MKWLLYLIFHAKEIVMGFADIKTKLDALGTALDTRLAADAAALADAEANAVPPEAIQGLADQIDAFMAKINPPA